MLALYTSILVACMLSAWLYYYKFNMTWILDYNENTKLIEMTCKKVIGNQIINIENESNIEDHLFDIIETKYGLNFTLSPHVQIQYALTDRFIKQFPKFQFEEE